MGYVVSRFCNNTPHDCNLMKQTVQPLGFAMIPHMTVNNPLFVKDIFLLQEMLFGFRGVDKTWDPKMWIVWPLGFASIHHTIVSSPFFKTAYFSPSSRCPLCPEAIHKTCNLKKQTVQPLDFALILHMASRDPIF